MSLSRKSVLPGVYPEGMDTPEKLDRRACAPETSAGQKVVVFFELLQYRWSDIGNRFPARNQEPIGLRRLLYPHDG